MSTSVPRAPGSASAGAAPPKAAKERLKSVGRAEAPSGLRRLPGVYAPQDDTVLLADVLTGEVSAGNRVLDLCTGTGTLACTNDATCCVTAP